MGHKFFIITILLTAFQVFPQQYPDVTVHKILSSGINHLINQKYDKAETNFTRLKEKYPELPLGDIYLASLEIIKSYDLGIEYEDELIVSRLKTAIDINEKLLLKDGNSLWYKYFKGLVEGYYAYYEALNENWISAFTKGFSSVKNFRECLDDSSEFYEAYVAIGTYLYWKSRKLESLQWLPFIEDDTQTGIEYLEKAVELSSYNSFLAANSLIWIYIDLKDYNKAADTAEEILKLYPESRFFKWGLARALEDTDKKKSIAIYYDILHSYKNPSDINEVIIKHKIAQQYHSLGNNEMSLKLCSEILSKKLISEYAQYHLNSRLARVQELYDELNK